MNADFSVSFVNFLHHVLRDFLPPIHLRVLALIFTKIFNLIANKVFAIMYTHYAPLAHLGLQVLKASPEMQAKGVEVIAAYDIEAAA